MGLSKALELACEEMEYQEKRLKKIRDNFEERLLNKISDIKINSGQVLRLPHISNVGFKGVEAESIILHLDLKGIAVSSGSACTTGLPEYSHVLKAMNVPPEIANGSIRFSMGRKTKEDDMEYTLEVLEETIKKLRKISPVT